MNGIPADIIPVDAEGTPDQVCEQITGFSAPFLTLATSLKVGKTGIRYRQRLPDGRHWQGPFTQGRSPGW